MWFVNQGRKYVEAPRWAAMGVVIVMLVFAYNVIGTAIRAKKNISSCAVQARTARFVVLAIALPLADP
jgi:nitric oxide reductase subunit B